MLNLMKMNFSNLSLSLETSLQSFDSNVSSILSFIEFEFLKNTNTIELEFHPVSDGYTDETVPEN